MHNTYKKIINLQEVDSTNNYANGLIQSKSAIEGTAVLAHYQKSGRGYTGNHWESEPDKNLLISIILFPEFLPVSKQFYLSKITSLALRDLLTEKGQRVSIKWPNDIYIDNKKIAGILIENTITGNFLSSSVLGIGLNLNQESFSSNIPNAVSLKQITGLHYDTRQMARSLLNYVEIWYGKLKAHSLEEIDEQYNANLYKINEWSLFKSSEQTFEARISDIGEYGHLILENRNGETKKFMFKEVEFVL